MGTMSILILQMSSKSQLSTLQAISLEFQKSMLTIEGLLTPAHLHLLYSDFPTILLFYLS